MSEKMTPVGDQEEPMPTADLARLDPLWGWYDDPHFDNSFPEDATSITDPNWMG